MKKFLADQEGATAIEYCIIGAAMTAMLVAAMPLITNGVIASYTGVATRISTGK